MEFTRLLDHRMGGEREKTANGGGAMCDGMEFEAIVCYRKW